MYQPHILVPSRLHLPEGGYHLCSLRPSLCKGATGCGNTHLWMGNLMAGLQNESNLLSSIDGPCFLLPICDVFWSTWHSCQPSSEYIEMRCRSAHGHGMHWNYHVNSNLGPGCGQDSWPPGAPASGSVPVDLPELNRMNWRTSSLSWAEDTRSMSYHDMLFVGL